MEGWTAGPCCAGLLAGTGVLAGLAASRTPTLRRRRRRPPAGPGSGRFELDPASAAAFVLASHPRPVAEAIERHRRGLQAGADGYLEDHGQRLDRQARSAAAEYLAAPARRPTTRASWCSPAAPPTASACSTAAAAAGGQEVVTTTHDFYST